MRIHDGEYTIGRILEDCRLTRRESAQPGIREVDGLDLNKLARRLEDLPVEETRRRRARLNAFYEEVLVSADPERGIPFTSCLMILAHYNIISETKSLRCVPLYFVAFTVAAFLQSPLILSMLTVVF